MVIYKYENIAVNRLKIKKPYMISNKEVILYPIEYNKQYFMIQTPKAIICNKLPINALENVKFYKTSLLFEHYKFSKSTNDFIQCICDIETTLIKKRAKFANAVYIKSINFTNSDKNCYFNMHIQMLDGKPVLPIFDYKKRLRDTAYVPRGSNCISIVYLKDMWFNNNKFGFNWILIQSKVYLPFVYIKRCLISEENEIPLKQPLTKKTNSPDLTKYQKMLKFGVPLEVIKMDLKKNGIPYSSFETSTISNEKYVSPKPIINTMMLKNVRLKKRKKKKRSKLSKKYKEQSINKDDSKYRPPSSNELKALLSKLKSRSV